MSAFAKLQAALLARVSSALGGAVPGYDHVPENRDPVFFVIGADSATANNSKTKNGVAHQVDVAVYSSRRGLAEVKQHAETIYDALQNHVLTITGVQAYPALFEAADFELQDDGAVGRLKFTITTLPE